MPPKFAPTSPRAAKYVPASASSARTCSGVSAHCRISFTLNQRAASPAPPAGPRFASSARSSSGFTPTGICGFTAMRKSSTPAPRMRRMRSSGSSRLVRLETYASRAATSALISLERSGNDALTRASSNSRGLAVASVLPSASSTSEPSAARLAPGLFESSSAVLSCARSIVITRMDARSRS